MMFPCGSALQYIPLPTMNTTVRNITGTSLSVHSICTKCFISVLYGQSHGLLMVQTYQVQQPLVLQGHQRPENNTSADCRCHSPELQIETNNHNSDFTHAQGLSLTFMALQVINFMFYSYLPLRTGVIMVDRRLPPLMHRQNTEKNVLLCFSCTEK